jgi:hypothetical protein
LGIAHINSGAAARPVRRVLSVLLPAHCAGSPSRRTRPAKSTGKWRKKQNIRQKPLLHMQDTVAMHPADAACSASIILRETLAGTRTGGKGKTSIDTYGVPGFSVTMIGAGAAFANFPPEDCRVGAGSGRDASCEKGHANPFLQLPLPGRTKCQSGGRDSKTPKSAE